MRLTPGGRATFAVLAGVVWLYGAYQTRDVDSDVEVPSVPVVTEASPSPLWSPEPRASRATRSRPSEVPSRPSLGHLDWAALARCESGGDPRALSPTRKHRGLYQFSLRSWRWVGMSGDPIDVSPATQLEGAKRLYLKQGRSAWPICGKHL